MAAPPNDNFANAEVLGGTSGSTSGTTKDATHEVGEPTIINANEQSVWYKITPGTTGEWRFTIPQSSVVFVGSGLAGSARLMIFEALVDTLAEATRANQRPNGFIDDSVSSSSSGDADFSVQLYAGNTYYLKVCTGASSPVQNAGVINYTLQWALVAGPTNDDLVDAVSFSTPPDSVTNQTTRDASSEDNEVSNFGFGDDQSVWYEFTPSTSGKYRISIDNISQDALISQNRCGLVLLTGSSHPLTSLSQRIGELNSLDPVALRYDLISGTSYKIKVYNQGSDFSYNNFYTFDFDVNIEEIDTSGSPPANDDVANAQELGIDPTGPFSGSNIFATYESFESADFYTQPSVWYHFTISVDGPRDITITKIGTDPDWQPYAEFYTDTGSPVDINDDFYDSTDNDNLPTVGSATINFVAGDYYMAVYNWNFDGSWDDFEIEFSGFSAPPPNDNFANRVDLPYHYAVTVDGTTDGATNEVGSSEPVTNPGSHSPPYPSVWYEYQSPNYNNEPSDIIFDTEGSPTDTFLEIFTGSFLGGLVLQASDHNSGVGGRSKIIHSSNGDVNYKIRVSSPPGSEGPFSLHINVDPGGSPPANDDFANAILLSGYSDSDSGTTADATGEYDDRGAGFDGPNGESTNTVWYKWIPPQTGRVLLTVNDASNNVYASIWRGTTLTGLVLVEGITASGTDASDAVTFQAEGGITYYFKIEGNGGFEAAFTIAVEMANISPPANDEPTNAEIISPVSGVIHLTTPTIGALWDTVGPYAGDFITNADQPGSIWYKFTTDDEYGSITIENVSETNVNGLSPSGIGRISLFKGSDITTATEIVDLGVGESFEIALDKNETYWISVVNYYWSTSIDVKLTTQFQHDVHEGVSTDPVNGTSDFDSVSGGFSADETDGEFVASGGVGFGRIQPWTANGHFPYGWWCRFDLNSTSGDYLYRFGQTEQYIEFFRATKAGGEYHSLYLVGLRNGTQEIQVGINGTILFNSGYKVFGINKLDTSEKVRIEVGENGVTIDGYCFVKAVFDFQIFRDFQDDQFDQFDFGILNYPGNGSAYVDLDPEWNLRFSNIRIHDNPEECVMGTQIEGVKEVASIAGWTQGFDYYKPNSISFGQLSASHLAAVVPSEGDYDGFSLDCSVASPSNTNSKGYRWTPGNSQPGVNIYYDPYVSPANDSYFPGFSFRFWISEMPSADLVYAFICTDAAGSDLASNGCFLILETDGTLSIKPSKFSEAIPFCHTEVDKWNYIEFQADTSSRKYATNIWLDDVFMGRFETTFVPNSVTTGVPNRPPQWGTYAIGRLRDAVSVSSGFLGSATTIGIQFRDIATTRRKVDRPLGPTVVIAKSIEADGTHNYPDPDTFVPGVTDEGDNSDFSAGTDGAGQPHYWTGYDRHDEGGSHDIPAGAMFLGYLFQTFPNSLVSLTTDGSGPPGHTGENALRIEAVENGAGAAYVFGGANEPAIDLTYPLNYADALSAQFWIKGVAGQIVRLKANSGIGDVQQFNQHTMSGNWEHVRLWLEPNSVVGTIFLTDVWLDFPNAVSGNIYLVKDFHLYLNPKNNPPRFYESSDGGASGVIVPFDATNTWTYLDDMPPDADATQIYANTRNFLNLVRGREDDGKTHLPPLWSDHYLEWRFADYDIDAQVFAAKIIVSIKGYNGEANTNDDPPDLDAYVQGGYVLFTIADGDDAVRFIGKHSAHIHIDDPDQTFYGIQLTRPPGNSEWNLSTWNATRLRLMSHDKTFSDSLVIVGDFTQSGLIEGAVAEILTYDRRLTPPSCKQLIAVYTTVELT